MVHRAHDLTLWSRLGRYRLADFHQLIYSDEVAKAMRDFMAWHGAKELRVGKIRPAGFGKKLTAAVIE